MRRAVPLILALCACSRPDYDPDDDRYDDMAQEIADLSAQLDQTADQLEQIQQQLREIDTKLSRPPAPALLPAAAPQPMPAPQPDVEAEAIAAGISCTEDRCTIKRKQWDALAANPAMLASTVRVVPAMRDNQPVGYKLYAIRPGTIPNLLGFQNGDTLTTIGGKPLTDVEGSLAAFDSLKDATELQVGFDRRGTAMTRTFVVQ